MENISSSTISGASPPTVLITGNSSYDPIIIDSPPAQLAGFDEAGDEGEQEGTFTEEEESFDEEDYDDYCDCGDCDCHSEPHYIVQPTRKAKRKLKPRPPPDLSQIKPINIHIPLEIWLEIFSYCHPRFLVTYRQLSKSHKHLLDTNKSVLKRARENISLPDPVFGLTEYEMWNLYWGTGCMICDAGYISKYKVRRPLWQYKIRCCALCFEEKSIAEENLSRQKWFKLEWTNLLVTGPPITGDGAWAGFTMDDYTPRYWLADVEALKEKMKNPETVSIETFETLMAEAREIQKITNRMDVIWATVERHRQEWLVYLAEERRETIIKRCSQLDPPMDETHLCEIEAYQKAADIPRPLSERSWRILLKKIKAESGRVLEIFRLREEAQEKEKQICLNRKNRLLEIRNTVDAAKPLLVTHINEFISKNGGLPALEFRGSFILAALDYARSKWGEMEESRGKYLPLGLVKVLFEGIFAKKPEPGLQKTSKRPLSQFKCGLCDRKWKKGSRGGGTLFQVLKHFESHQADECWAEIQKPFKGLKGATEDPYSYRFGPTENVYDVQTLLASGSMAAWFELEQSPIQSTGPNYDPENRATVLALSTPSTTLSHVTAGPSGAAPIASTNQTLPPKRKQKQGKDESQTTSNLKSEMQAILLRTSTLTTVPAHHRLFLWYRLSVTLYTEQHTETATIYDFVLAAEQLRLEGQDAIFASLKCGICGSSKSRSKKNPFNWCSLKTHFESHGKEAIALWAEKLLWRPTVKDIREISVHISDAERETWVKMLGNVGGWLVDEILGEEGEIMSEN